MADIASQSLKDFYRERRHERRRAMIAKEPRVRWIWFERDIFSGPFGRSVGVMWDKNLDAEEGEMIYQRRIILHFAFRLNLEWR